MHFSSFEFPALARYGKPTLDFFTNRFQIYHQCPSPISIFSLRQYSDDEEFWKFSMPIVAGIWTEWHEYEKGYGSFDIFLIDVLCLIEKLEIGKRIEIEIMVERKYFLTEKQKFKGHLNRISGYSTGVGAYLLSVLDWFSKSLVPMMNAEDHDVIFVRYRMVDIPIEDEAFGENGVADIVGNGVAALPEIPEEAEELVPAEALEWAATKGSRRRAFMEAMEKMKKKN